MFDRLNNLCVSLRFDYYDGQIKMTSSNYQDLTHQEMNEINDYLASLLNNSLSTYEDVKKLCKHKEYNDNSGASENFKYSIRLTPFRDAYNYIKVYRKEDVIIGEDL